LKDLQVAKNKISSIPDIVVDNLIHLEHINIANNEISSFQEFIKLSRFPALRRVSFSDPHYGACPVCHLFNYQMILFSIIKQASIVDFVPISTELKKNSEYVLLLVRLL
jgi:Leucine-rich repeat (LRR) protein